MDVKNRAAACAWLTGSLIPRGAAHAADDLAAGKQIYRLLCAQCHGDDGDATGYPDIVPVAGIGRRYPPEVIGKLSGAFSGRSLSTADRKRVVQYMMTLRGSKGLADPGWLITPQMLERKAPRIREFRVLDARGEDAYAAGHIANAVFVGQDACSANAEDTARWLGNLGVTPATMVVIYDGTGGPAAACVWWRIRQAGHQWVAILDGGWKRWTAERRFTTTGVPKIEPDSYPAPDPPAGVRATGALPLLTVGGAGWNWKEVVGPDGFRHSDELTRLAERGGLRRAAAFRVAGALDEVAHLLLALHLLGYQASYDPQTTVLAYH